MADNPNVKTIPHPPGDKVEFDYSKALVVHAIGEKFQINADPNGTVMIAFAANTMDPAKAQVQVVAHLTPGLFEPLLNAMGLIANRMGIKVHNSIQ
jgi:hypothetical protein